MLTLILQQEQTVHTSGINWESVAVIVSAIVGCVGAFTAWVGRQITVSINHLSDTLMAKLETKENVTAINLRLTTLEQTVRDKWQHDQ